MIKLIKKISYVFIFTLLILCSSVNIFASDESIITKPKVISSDITLKQGNSGYVTISASNFVSAGSFEVYVIYDESILTITSNYTTGLLSSEVVSTNTTEAGVAKLNVISLSGINGSGNLWKLYFRANSDATAGASNIKIVIGEAYDIYLNPIEIEGSSFYINVEEKVTSIQTVKFMATNPSSIKEGENTSISYYVSGSSKNFSSAEFEINYDERLLELESIEIGKVLSNVNGALVSVNDNIDGYVKISFAALAGVNSYIYSSNPLFKLNFKGLTNTDKKAEVIFDAVSLYDINLNPISGNTVTSNIQMIYEEPEVVLPNIELESYDGYDKEFSVKLKADLVTNLACGDFVLNYDPKVLSCIGLEKIYDSSVIVSNIKLDGNGNEIGEVKFSYIYSDGISESEEFVLIKFKPLGVFETILNITGSGLRNSNYEAVECNVNGANVKITHELITVDEKKPTCLEHGWNEYVKCANCLYSTYDENYLEPLGHSYGDAIYTWSSDHLSITAKRVCNNDNTHIEEETVKAEYNVVTKPLCDVKGLGRYTSNTFINQAFSVQTYDVIIEPLGHSYESVVTNPTCLDKGYTTHTCHCGDTYVDSLVEPLGHSYGDATYAWSSDHLNITAKRVCNNDNTHIEEEKVKAEYNVLTKPLCDVKGLGRYTSNTFINQAFSVQTYDVIIEPLGHSYESVVTNPTCLDKGYTTHTCHCGDTYTDSLVEPLGHNLVVDSKVEPTCTETGLTEGSHCDRCNVVLEPQKVIEPLGHNYDSVVTSPTCLDKGYTTHTCNVCSDTYTDSFVEAFGHSYGDATYTWTNDYLSITAKRVCNNDNTHIEEETVNSVSAIIQNQTCILPELTTYTAVFTNSNFTEQVKESVVTKEAKGHDYESVVINPTCTEEGYTVHTCNECNDTYKDEYINALGHNMNPATTEHPSYCDRCGYTEGDVLVEKGGCNKASIVNFIFNFYILLGVVFVFKKIKIN